MEQHKFNVFIINELWFNKFGYCIVFPCPKFYGIEGKIDLHAIIKVKVNDRKDGV